MNIQGLRFVSQHNLQQIINALEQIGRNLEPAGCFVVSVDSYAPACKPVSQTGLDVAVYWNDRNTMTQEDTNTDNRFIIRRIQGSFNHHI